MNILNNLSIRTKIMSIVASLAAVMAIGAIFAAQATNSLVSSYNDFLAKETQAAINLTAANRNLQGVGYAAYQSLRYDSGTEQNLEAVKNYRSNAKNYVERMKLAATSLPEETATFDGFLNHFEEIQKLVDRAVALGAENRNDESAALLGQADGMVTALALNMQKSATALRAQVDEQTQLLGAEAADMVLAIEIGAAAAILIALAGAYWFASNGISRPLQAVTERMKALANGDTDSPIAGVDRGDEVGTVAKALNIFREAALENRRLGEEADANRSHAEKERIAREEQKAREAEEIRFAVDALASGLGRLSDGDVSSSIDTPFVQHLDKLRHDFNSTVATLQSTLKAVGDNARAIDSGANEIRSAADDLSKRTEQQAASVEETAAALEQITTTVKDASHRAEEAGQLVQRTKSGAEKSGEIVQSAIHAMSEIERSSTEITNIIGVIDEIAFQTNLLALNAGVEAARAGEAGKGFAVVAQEVRELAQRSAAAAKEIKSLISASSQHVERGVGLVADTGKALQAIVSEVQEINRLVAGIVESAREQSVGLNEINMAVNTIDQNTQQNAAMVEESNAASHSLAREAEALNRLIAQFNVGDGRQTRAPVAVSVPSGTGTAPRASKPASNPVRALGRKVAAAFVGNAAVKVSDDWEEF
ncbi:methyl-accepting chemotaxis protein [Rhizobium sp. ARZ01]|uniref:methyl-accepting chemotaxis protein n=1 Tax=Rhizobium sp. ARZ01 TaxID=2769313 RepID=UPI001782800E|nr:HAMP domain-containing methyl-accepting chemotaxis protein [Rhizobium sp. ARZ01]MBD9374146.1 methyl-accepting chemotaxis protein [Rhizobium sp. ARZ01]